jgi:hypothetical protein
MLVVAALAFEREEEGGELANIKEQAPGLYLRYARRFS